MCCGCPFNGFGRIFFRRPLIARENILKERLKFENRKRISVKSFLQKGISKGDLSVCCLKTFSFFRGGDDGFYSDGGSDSVCSDFRFCSFSVFFRSLMIFYQSLKITRMLRFDAKNLLRPFHTLISVLKFKVSIFIPCVCA